MDEGVAVHPSAAPFLQQPRPERRVQAIQQLRFGLPTGLNQHRQLDLLADHARQAKQLLRLWRQSANAMIH